MKIKKLILNGFRNYGFREIKFDKLNLIIGDNARGKTNILEAMYLLSTGESFRAGKIEEMIGWDKDVANVEGYIESDEGDDVVLGVVLTRGVLMGKRTPKRKYFVDRVSRKKARFLGSFYTVVFKPEDLRLVEGSPGRRRRFLDEVLGMVDVRYKRSLSIYENALRRRNKILDLIRDGSASREQLAFWDMSLIKHGNVISDARRKFIDFLNDLSVEFGRYKVVYDFSAISESRLGQYAREEVLAGYTLVGPHKDDFVISSLYEMTDGVKKWKNLHVYGSRGEQRLGVLFLKYGTIRYIEEVVGMSPVFLLDDIFSELDEKHKREVLSMARDRQTVITSADEYVLDDLNGMEVSVIRV